MLSIDVKSLYLSLHLTVRNSACSLPCWAQGFTPAHTSGSDATLQVSVRGEGLPRTHTQPKGARFREFITPAFPVRSPKPECWALESCLPCRGLAGPWNLARLMSGLSSPRGMCCRAGICIIHSDSMAKQKRNKTDFNPSKHHQTLAVQFVRDTKQETNMCTNVDIYQRSFSLRSLLWGLQRGPGVDPGWDESELLLHGCRVLGWTGALKPGWTPPLILGKAGISRDSQRPSPLPGLFVCGVQTKRTGHLEGSARTPLLFEGCWDFRESQDDLGRKEP